MQRENARLSQKNSRQRRVVSANHPITILLYIVSNDLKHRHKALKKSIGWMHFNSLDDLKLRLHTPVNIQILIINASSF